MNPLMTTPVRVDPADDTVDRSDVSTTVRVAPREIKDLAYRALRVRGTSAGEATLAARAITAAHLRTVGTDAGDGLAMLLDELPRTVSQRAGACFTAEAVPVLRDEARRGLFFAVPAGVEHLLAHPGTTAVLLPGVSWRRGADALVTVAAGEDAGALHLEDAAAQEAGEPALLLRRRDAPAAPTPLPPGAAESSGVEVDAEQWRAARAAAEPYLVPEP